MIKTLQKRIKEFEVLEKERDVTNKELKIKQDDQDKVIKDQETKQFQLSHKQEEELKVKRLLMDEQNYTSSLISTINNLPFNIDEIKAMKIEEKVESEKLQEIKTTEAIMSKDLEDLEGDCELLTKENLDLNVIFLH